MASIWDMLFPGASQAPQFGGQDPNAQLPVPFPGPQQAPYFGAIPKPGQSIAATPDQQMMSQQAAQGAVSQLRPYWMDLDPTDQEIAQRQSAMQTGQTQPGKVLPTTGMNPVPFAMLDAASMLPAGGLAKFASGLLGLGVKRALGAAAEAGAGAAERGVAGAAAEAAQPGIRAYHGSPHDFTQFDLSKIGTGEGAQAYGHGLYMAENEAVAREYRNTLADWKVNGAAPDPSDPAHIAAVTLKANEADPNKAIADLTRTTTQGPVAERATAAQAIDLIRNGAALPKATGGHMYEVNIGARPEHFLDWDKPLSEQPHIQSKLPRIATDVIGNRDVTGGELLQKLGAPEVAHRILKEEMGVPGIKYLDQGSRITGGVNKLGDNYFFKGSSVPYKTRAEAEAAADQAGSVSHNYVVFDPKMIEIMRKYGIAAGMLGGGAAASQLPIPPQKAPVF